MGAGGEAGRCEECSPTQTPWAPDAHLALRAWAPGREGEREWGVCMGGGGGEGRCVQRSKHKRKQETKSRKERGKRSGKQGPASTHRGRLCGGVVLELWAGLEAELCGGERRAHGVGHARVGQHDERGGAGLGEAVALCSRLVAA